jgi:hypothetical protein
MFIILMQSRLGNLKITLPTLDNFYVFYLIHKFGFNLFTKQNASRESDHAKVLVYQNLDLSNICEMFNLSTGLSSIWYDFNHGKE